MTTETIEAGDERLDAAARGAADFLRLAAAPTFAIMALLTGVPGGGPHILCSAAPHGSAMSGMVAMYLLMSAFHLSPWLKLIAGRTNASRSPSESRQTCHSRHSKLDVNLFHDQALMEKDR
jgi:hypothetical protein